MSCDAQIVDQITSMHLCLLVLSELEENSQSYQHKNGTKEEKEIRKGPDVSDKNLEMTSDTHKNKQEKGGGARDPGSGTNHTTVSLYLVGPQHLSLATFGCVSQADSSL